MPIRSHVDPCLFVTFIHVKDDLLNSELDQVLAALNARHGDSFAPILDQLHPRTRQLVFHETYHFWQGLRLPFLFRYAFLAYRQSMMAFKELSKHSTAFQEWSCALPEFERLTVHSELALSKAGKLQFGSSLGSPPSDFRKITLSPLILLESATTLAEFQASNTDRFDPKTFSRWCKRNPAYTEVFALCSEFLGSAELTLRCLLPLINASFHTTRPERAFFELLARTWGAFRNPEGEAAEFLQQPEPCRWTDVYQRMLAGLKYDPPSAKAEIFEHAFYQLELDSWVYGGYGANESTHPFLGPLARLWRDKEKSEYPGLSTFLDQPGVASSTTFSFAMDAFLPPVTVYRFHRAGRDKVA